MPDNLASTCDSQLYMSYPPSSMTVVELEEACGGTLCHRSVAMLTHRNHVNVNMPACVMINCVGEQFIDFQKTLSVVSTMLWVGTKFEG